MHTNDGINEHGVAVANFLCDSCGHSFSVIPAPSEMERDQWQDCLDDACSSYSADRDAALYLMLGMVEGIA